MHCAACVHVPGPVHPGKLDIQLPDAFNIGQGRQINIIIEMDRFMVDLKGDRVVPEIQILGRPLGKGFGDITDLFIDQGRSVKTAGQII